MAEIVLNPAQIDFRKKMANPFLFRLFLLFKIPLGFLSGMKVAELSPARAVSTLPFKWLNRNPFRSMYFGAQCMAAELCTGAIALMAIRGHSPSVAGIVTATEGEFLKQGKGKIYFNCDQGTEIFEAIEACKSTQEGVTVRVKSTGTTADGTVISVFYFTWSFRQRA